jgi:hypothetical protein
VTSIILNFNMWECKLKRKIPCIATVRSEFFFMYLTMCCRTVLNLERWPYLVIYHRAGDGERVSTGAAEGAGGGAGPSGSGSGPASFGRVRTRAELEKMINNSVRPFYIKQEVLDEEANNGYGRMDMDGEPQVGVGEAMEDVQVVDVVVGEEKKTDTSSEESESEEEMEDGNDPDPVLNIRGLFEEQEEQSSRGSICEASPG